MKMSALILRGAEVAQKIKDEVRAYTEENPGINLTIFQVGDNPASNTYIRNKVRACADCGMDSSVDKYADPQEYDRCIDIPDALRYCTGSGVMLQLPLPKGWDEDYFVNCINASQDADCLTHVSLGGFYASKSPEIAPCTARGIIDILKYYNIEIAGKHAVVVGRSNIVGKPMAMLLLHANGTVTVCHSRTKDLAAVCREADILVAMAIKHQIRYPLYYVKKLQLTLSEKQQEYFAQQREQVEKTLDLTGLSGKHLVRKIDDNTFINFADFINIFCRMFHIQQN